jgi:hypothetical protein
MIFVTAHLVNPAGQPLNVTEQEEEQEMVPRAVLPEIPMYSLADAMPQCRFGLCIGTRAHTRLHLIFLFVSSCKCLHRDNVSCEKNYLLGVFRKKAEEVKSGID